ncbi:MAG: ROK family protein [Candidatus Acidiferrum sp.]|jgi:glucokinase
MAIPETKKTMVVGVDVGGTKVAVGLVNAQGQIVATRRRPMNASGDAASGFNSVTSAIDALFAENPGVHETIRAIGICAPGPLDPFTGVVVNPPNLKCWRNFPLGGEVSQRYGVPVRVDNDGNAAALAEFLWGAGRGFKTVFYTCIGTGIGTGIIFDGRIYHGRTGAAAEGGHVSIDYRGPVCGCGKRGCIEILAAGPAIARRAQAKLAAEPERASALRELAGNDPGAVTSEMVGKANAIGDALAKEVLLETVELLAFWLANVVDFLEPDVMIIGGGVASMLNPFFDVLDDRIAFHCVNSRSREIPLRPAHYGADSGIAGGAALCNDLA